LSQGPRPDAGRDVPIMVSLAAAARAPSRMARPLRAAARSCVTLAELGILTRAYPIAGEADWILTVVELSKVVSDLG
jgi:hypothetical protein